MANGWSLERRKRQSALIRTWRPWERSTGPRTTSGKDRAKMNRYQGGRRAELRAVRLALLELFGEHAQVLHETGTRATEVADEKQAAAPL